MRIFVTGGSGFVGKYLTRRLAESGHEIVVVTRSPERAERDLPWAAVVEGDPKKPGIWQQEAAKSDAVVNLAGTSIFTLWTDSARKSIVNSRVLTTRNVVEALSGSGQGKTLVSTSAVGYYGSRMDDVVFDENGPPGSEFMSEVCVKWEEEAAKAEQAGTRVVICRLGIVLGRDGGVLTKMVPAFSRFMGTSLGSGRQWFAWIHQEDLYRIFSLALEDPELRGPVNCVAPNPARNSEFAHVLASVLRRPLLLPPVPAFFLRTLLGEFGNVLIKGQKVAPAKLLERGFSFRYPTVRQALEDLLERRSD